MSRQRLAVGDVIQVPEDAYCYGLGELYARITALPRPAGPDGWLELRCVEMDAEGREYPQRWASVRLDAVRVMDRAVAE